MRIFTFQDILGKGSFGIVVKAHDHRREEGCCFENHQKQSAVLPPGEGGDRNSLKVEPDVQRRTQHREAEEGVLRCIFGFYSRVTNCIYSGGRRR